MPRDVRVHLEDILEACARISDYSSRMSLEDFRNDRKTSDAVIRNPEVIGEAAKKIPDQVRQIIDVECKRIAGLKDILIHEYFRVDLEIVWDVVQTKIPDLAKGVSDYLTATNL